MTDVNPFPAPQCRKFTPPRTTKFKLEVHSAAGSDVTVWLPSDFKGRIHRSSMCKKVSFSAGFTNAIMRNVCLTQSRRPSVVSTADSAAYHFSEIYVSDGPHRAHLAPPPEKRALPHYAHDREKIGYGLAAAAATTAAASGFGGDYGGFSDALARGAAEEDEVVVDTTGTVTFRMWDIHRGEPEARCREACKRAFGLGWCAKRAPEVAIDWDFLLED